MADLTTSIIPAVLSPELNYKRVLFETPSTAVSADTFTVSLSKYGIKKILAIVGTVHTTANSVLVPEGYTSSVTGDTLTLTVGGVAVTGLRVYELIGK